MKQLNKQNLASLYLKGKNSKRNKPGIIIGINFIYFGQLINDRLETNNKIRNYFSN